MSLKTNSLLTWAVLAGLLLGGCAGLPLGAGASASYDDLGETDVALAAATMQASLEQKPHGDSAGWENATNGNRGSVMPTVTFVSDAGFLCRDYEETLSLADGRHATIMNTACRDTKGYRAWIAD